MVTQERACDMIARHKFNEYPMDHKSDRLRNLAITEDGLTSEEVDYIFVVRDMLPEADYNNGMGPSFTDAMIYIAGGCI